jgi:phosphate uptake regulator
MQRSLIQLSPSTAVVSLPSSWVARNKLKKGTKLDVQENENNIVISAHGKKAEKEITLDLSSISKKSCWFFMDAAYVSGYDAITIITKDSAQQADMHKMVKYFPGMIIEEERKNSVQFKDMVLESGTDLDKLLSRIFHSTAVMIDDARDALANKEWQVLLDMKRRDYNINTYVSLAQRHVSKYGFTPFSKTGVIYCYLKMLEMVADKICALIMGLGERKEGGKTEQNLLQDIGVLYREASSLRSKYSVEKIMVFESSRSKMLAQLPKLHQHAHIYATEVLELLFEISELEATLRS